MIKTLMMDVDGVLVSGRPSDGLSWETQLQADLGVDPDDFRRAFFERHWDDIVVGRADLSACLEAVL